MPDSIDNSKDIIDSRDVIARIAELENDREALTDAVQDAQRAFDEALGVKHSKAARHVLQVTDLDACVATKQTLNDAQAALEDWEDAEELKTLKALAEEAEGYGDWAHGATLIRDSYFTEYAEELASDVCEMGKATEWPFRHIDWEAAANELRQDYTTVTFDGEDYLIRS
jgi:hypothetical protein